MAPDKWFVFLNYLYHATCAPCCTCTSAAILQSPRDRATERNRARLESAERAYIGESASVYAGGGEVASVGYGGAADGDSETGDDTQPLDTNTQLQLIFQYYCRFGRTGGSGDEQDTLDSFNLMKFARECPALLDRTLNPTEIDLIFCKCKSKAARRLTYGQFLDALSAVSSVKYPSVEDPVTAFSLLLANHVFQCPASVGISVALKSGMLQLAAPAAASGTSASPSAPAPEYPSRRSSLAHVGSPRLAASQLPPPQGFSVSPLPAANVYDVVTRGAAAVSAAQPPPYASIPRAYPTGAGTPGGLYSSAPFAAAYPVAAASPINSSTPQHYQPMTVLVPTPGAPGDAAAGIPAGFVPMQVMMPVAAAAALPSYSHPPAAEPADYPSSRPAERGRQAAIPGSGAATSGALRARSARAQQQRSGSVVSRSASPRGGRAGSTLGSRDYRPTLAGAANKPGGVYDRLASPDTFTGVYRRAWLTDGRLNQGADTGVSNMPSRFNGHTNTNSDETIHDIKVLLRPNLAAGKGFR